MSFAHSSQARRQSVNKIKEDIQLPKINKHIHEQPKNYIQRYEWLTRKSEYLLLSQAAIQQEQEYLMNQLNTLNQQYTDLLTNINSQNKVKPLKKSRQLNIKDKSQEYRDREIDNNYIIMSKLKSECQILQKRMCSVSGGQSQFDRCMIETKEKILKVKQKIKQLKLRSKQMGQNIQNGPDLFIDLKKMQNEKNVAENKKHKLYEKIENTQINIIKLNQQLEEIAPTFLYAQSYLQQQSINDKANAQQRTMEQLYRQKLYQLQITRKTIQSFKNVRQQKYLQNLKALQGLIEINKSLNTKVQKLQIKNLTDKKQIIQLQELLFQAIQYKARSKTSQESKDDVSVYHGNLDKGSTSRQDISYNRGKFYNNIKQNQVRYRKNIISGLKQQQKSTYAQRLRSSETKSQIYQNYTLNKINLEKKTETNLSNLNNQFQINSTQINAQQGNQAELLKMIIQPPNFNRGAYIRNSKTKLKQTIQDYKNNTVTLKQSNPNNIQKITQQSPNKEDQIQQQEEPIETINAKQQTNSNQLQQVNDQSGIKESILKQNDDIGNRKQGQGIQKTISVKSDMQKSRLRLQQDLINNYVNKMEQEDDQQYNQQI